MQSSISELPLKRKTFKEKFEQIEHAFNMGALVNDQDIAWMIMQVKRLEITADRSNRRKKALRGLQKAHEAMKERFRSHVAKNIISKILREEVDAVVTKG